MKKNILDELFEEIQGSKSLKRTENRMLLAQKIDMGMKAKGWNKTKFAKEMIQKPSVITRWLSGTHNFTSDTLTDIGESLGINLLDSNLDNSKPSIFIQVSTPSNQKEIDVNSLYQNSILVNSTYNPN